MATATKFQQFVEDLAHKVHNLETDQLEIALSTSANAPSASLDAVLGDFTQIAYTNLSARTVTTTSSGQAAGTYTLVLTDLILTASGAVATFRHVTLFNQTATNDPLLMTWDYAADVTLANGETFTIDFAATTISLT